MRCLLLLAICSSSASAALQHCAGLRPFAAAIAAPPQRRAVAPRADITSFADVQSFGDFWSLFNQSPFQVNYKEAMSTSNDLGVVQQITGISLTPSGYLFVVLIALQQLFAPWGWVKYKKRLEDDEARWLELGKSPEQALTNAYQNVRPPPREEADEADATEGEDGTESQISKFSSQGVRTRAGSPPDRRQIRS